MHACMHSPAQRLYVKFGFSAVKERRWSFIMKKQARFHQVSLDRPDENLKHVVHVLDLRFFWLEISILPCYVYVDCVYVAHHS